MTSHIIIVDASIAVKVLHDEPDSKQAKGFFKSCAEENARLLVPEHFLYELVNVCQRVGVEVENVLEFYDALKNSILTPVTPQKSVWLLAEKIAKDGHPQSGFPSIYDSIYHALAIEAGATFTTADKRHHSKAHRYGSILLLEEFGSS